MMGGWLKLPSFNDIQIKIEFHDIEIKIELNRIELVTAYINPFKHSDIFQGVSPHFTDPSVILLTVLPSGEFQVSLWVFL